ncbi:aminoacyl-tRNA hydrolase [Blattabacterium cuenoti]|uniref:aminoacyl-tRNA hydrolase n=1 Tax=Blattabacterium cuenoti TaxID=1653831 RepID=UPI00163CFC3C|nr:aminoacyl-tRNA hydrolase [Blattabacterium cuenoti]
MKNYLIVGLGNPGCLYKKTRHNIGFFLLDQISKKYSLNFVNKKFGLLSKFYYNNHLIFFLKPTTFINESGRSVKYWMKKKNVLLENILIISDDFYLHFGFIRFRGEGRSGGHNGLKSIEQEIKSLKYSRLRIGIRNKNFISNKKNYVLENWNTEEEKFLYLKSEKFIKMIFSFVLNGLQKTMNLFNGKIEKPCSLG